MSNLSVISTPPPVALLGEGLKFTLRNNVNTNGDKAYCSLAFGGAYTDYSNGITFTLTAIGKDYVFTFSDAPQPDDALAILPGQASETPADIRDRVMAALQQHFFFNENYTFSIDNFGLLMIAARKAGSQYDISLSHSDTTALSEDDMGHGADTLLPADYAFYLALIDYNKGKGALPEGEDLLPPVYRGLYYEADNNLADYARRLLTTGFTWPFSGNVITLWPNAVGKYFIRYAEYKNATFGKLFNTYDNPLLVLPGGLARADKDFLSGEGLNYFDVSDNDTRFLTWAPLTKTTFPYVPERLFFFLQQSGLKLMKKAVYADGTETTEKAADLGNANTIIEISCGATELFKGIDPTTLASYSVWIEDAAGNRVSEERIFTLDQNYYENIRTLVFRNSFGLYDLLHCTGQIAIHDNVKRNEISAYQTDSYRRRVFSSENVEEYQLNSGWLSGLDARNWLQDLLLSKEVSLGRGDYLMGVVMKTGKVLRETDNADLYSLQIVFEADINNKYFSDLIGDGIFVLADENGAILTDDNDFYLQQ